MEALSRGDGRALHGEVLAYGFSLEGKGKLWVDDVKTPRWTTAVPVTGPTERHQLGVIAQAVSLDGALANPTNLDFEDVQSHARASA